MRNDVALELFYDGAWRDMVSAERLLSAAPLQIQRPGAESSAPGPASLTARALNFDDALRPSNPESPLYETAGVNTPIRVTVGGTVRALMQVDELNATETPDFQPSPRRGSAAVGISALGVTAQVNQNATRLDSPQTRQVSTISGLLGFWPCEDESGASRLSNVLPGGIPGVYSDTTTLGVDDAPGGATRSIEAGPSSALGGTFKTSTASGWQFCFGAKLVAPLTPGYQELIRVVDSLGRTWAWEINEDSYAWRIYDSDGGTIDYQATLRGGVSVTEWIRHRLKVTVSAGTITLEAAWYQENADTGLGTTKTFSATSTGTLRRWVKPNTAYTDGARFSGIYGSSDASIDLLFGAIRDAFNGYRGERAGTRFVRIMSEVGLPATLIGSASDTSIMGPQPADTIPEILREIRDTEAGIMFDARSSNALAFMTRRARSNQIPVSISVSEMLARPREVTAGADIWNSVTVKQRGGAEAIAVDQDGPLGVTAKGPFERTIDVSVADEAELADLASWWLQRGTLNVPRYPSVTVDMTNMTPARVAEIEAIDVGSAIVIPDYRENPINLYVTAVTETVEWPNRRRLTLSCEPNDMFTAAVYDSARRDSSSTTLAAAAEAGQGTLSITTVDPADCWSTGSVPYLIGVAGEWIRVTACTAPSGTGPYTQTMTVTRSINGIRKRLAAGARVRLATPARYGLKGQ